MWRKGIPSRGTSKGKGLVSKGHLMCSVNSENTRKAGKMGARENRERNEVSKETRPEKTLQVRVRTLD